MARILIIDDDELFAELVVEALTGAGHMVSAVHDGGEAMGAIEASLPELLILDYALPGASGLEILRLVRQRRYGRDLPIIMLTAKTGRMLPIRAHGDDVDDYLVKPVALDMLVARVEALLRSGALVRQVSRDPAEDGSAAAFAPR